MTPIRQVELSASPQALRLPPDSSRCFLVFRWRGKVIGSAKVAARGGEVTVADMNTALRSALKSHPTDAWVDDVLDYDERRVLGAPGRSVSVAICTRERPDDLKRALDAVAQLRPAPLEVLVVDNAPATEATRMVVQHAGFPRYIREDRRGLNAARNRALREAAGDIVGFTDDDAVPEPEWLAALMANFADSGVMVTTGLTLPLELETEGQELFEEHCTFIRGFTRRVFDGQVHNPLAVGPVGAGANMAVRKREVLALGGFDERLDGGMPTRSGGDHELFVRVLSAGHRIVYEPAAVSWHRHRRTIQELLDTVYGYGVGVYAMWTGLLLERRESGVFRLAWQWLTHTQMPNLFGRDPVVRRIARHELRGCMRGPHAWLLARRLHRGRST